MGRYCSRFRVRCNPAWVDRSLKLTGSSRALAVEEVDLVECECERRATTVVSFFANGEGKFHVRQIIAVTLSNGQI